MRSELAGDGLPGQVSARGARPRQGDAHGRRLEDGQQVSVAAGINLQFVVTETVVKAAITLWRVERGKRSTQRHLMAKVRIELQ